MVCFYLFLRLETFYQGASSSDFQPHGESQILPFATPASGYYSMIQQQCNVPLYIGCGSGESIIFNSSYISKVNYVFVWMSKTKITLVHQLDKLRTKFLVHPVGTEIRVTCKQ